MSESGLYSPQDDALIDLLVQQATEGLSLAEQRELDAMEGVLHGAELLAFERAVAAVTLAGMPLTDPPAALQARLLRQAEQLLASNNVVALKAPGEQGDRSASPAAVATRAAAGAGGSTAPPLGSVGTVSSGRPASSSANWGWFAAAACLLLAIFGWVRSPPGAVAPVATVQTSPPPVVTAAPVEPPVAPVPPTPREERDAMLARSETIKVTLGATKDPAAVGVTGDAVWDPVTQQGFLHFVGLTGNDPRVRQYQIWLFDGKRDKRYPVDGGVFDVPAGSSEVVIPIRAALSIHQIKAFAVTVEQPGGVVVSGLGHVVALGAAGATG